MRFLLVSLGLTVRFLNSPRGIPGPRGRCRTFMKILDQKVPRKNRILPLKIAFFLFFENGDIFSSKSYTVTKSGISPQRKLGSLPNLKLLLIR